MYLAKSFKKQKVLFSCPTSNKKYSFRRAVFRDKHVRSNCLCLLYFLLPYYVIISDVQVHDPKPLKILMIAMFGLLGHFREFFKTGWINKDFLSIPQLLNWIKLKNPTTLDHFLSKQLNNNPVCTMLLTLNALHQGTTIITCLGPTQSQLLPWLHIGRILVIAWMQWTLS